MLIPFSGCSKFVLTTSGRVVFVCELLRRKPGIQPLTRVICPRKVLGVSMDTSSKRYAVAILLEGRVGICCSLTDGFGDASSAAATQDDLMYWEYLLKSVVQILERQQPDPQCTLCHFEELKSLLNIWLSVLY
jgi:hypothetical protein